METILVTDISSIGENFYSLKSKSGVIKSFPFICKKKPERKSSSSYHFDRNDLMRINQFDSRIYEYDARDWRNKRGFIRHIKYSLYEIIKEGKMVQLLSFLYDKLIEDVEIKWGKDEEPDFKL